MFFQLTGLSSAGKSTVANLVSERLQKRGYKIEVIDGDEYRTNLCKDLGFSKEDRNTNIRRLAFVAKRMSAHDIVCIIAAINPYDDVRQEVQQMGGKLVYVKCSLSTLKVRDTKGLYRRAFLPEVDPEYIPNFTGVSDPFEAPTAPDLVIDTDALDLVQAADVLYWSILSEINKLN